MKGKVLQKQKECFWGLANPLKGKVKTAMLIGNYMCLANVVVVDLRCQNPLGKGLLYPKVSKQKK
jgi:hypothetical protein